MAGAPDLFVVCKNCQSEVSPYITECPYCGQRLRKRAPKLDREGRVSEPVAPAPEPPRPRKPPRRVRPVERPAREPRVGPRRPVVTIALVLTALVLTLATQAGLLSRSSLIVDGSVEGEWWRLLTASFVYVSIGYQAVALTTIAVFGWLLERRHGFWATLVVYLLGTLLGMALVVLVTGDAALAVGGNAGALALLCAWAVRDVRGRRSGVEDDADMLGVAVWLAVLVLLPLATVEAHVLAGLGGAVAGILLGFPLARMTHR